MTEPSTKTFPKCIAKQIVKTIKDQVKLMTRDSIVINDEWEGKNDIFGLFEKKELQLGKLIGSGGFSDVYEVCGFSSSESSNRDWNPQQRLDRKIMKENAMDGNCKYVVKHLKGKMMKTTQKFCMAASDLAVEAQYLCNLNHDNIVKLRGWAATGIESYSEGNHNGYFLILDRLNDTLDNRLKKWRIDSDLSPKKAFSGGKRTHNDTLLPRIKVARQIASALRYLHSKNIVFRDLKPSNIGFDKFGIVKIFDFGLARELPGKYNSSKDEYYRMTGLVGTLRYMAPEVALSRNYNQKVDTYSWGIIFWSCLALTKVYANVNRRMYLTEVCLFGKRPALQSDWCCSIRCLLEKSWAQEPYYRITMVEVCEYLEQIEIDLGAQLKSSESLIEQQTNNTSLPPPLIPQARNTFVPFAA